MAFAAAFYKGQTPKKSAADEHLLREERMAIINGTNAGETLTGTSGDDTINGLGGNDQLFGGDGNDTLDGGTGNDTFVGGRGDDTFIGTDGGLDVVDYSQDGGPNGVVVNQLGNGSQGGLAADTAIDSFGDTDHIQGVRDVIGTAFADSIFGGNHDNTLSGGGGDDFIFGNDGADTLNGGGGNDRLDGGTGADQMSGGTGNDTYVVDNAGDVVIENANEGTDTVQTTLASYSLGANVENLTFTDNGAHTGNGNALDNVMTGGAGDDTLFGSGGKDVLDGGDGNDTLVGNDSGAGAFLSEGNTLDGGNGNDTLIAEVSDTVNGGAGTDSLQAENANPWTIDLGATSIETMLAGFGDDHIDGSTQTAGVTVFASGGNDTVIGSGHDDFLWGGVGNDTLTGGAGNDLLFGDLGADSLSGGDGNDTLYDDSSDAHIDGGAGTDALYWAAGVSANINLAADSIEFVQTLGDNDTLNGSASTANLIIFAGAGNDTATGGSGNDFLWGEAGNDTLVGGAGNDTLVGGSGVDHLTGGAGTDNLYGNNGTGGDGAADTFIFAASWGTDFVYDFEPGTDKLDLTALHLQPASVHITSSGTNAQVDIGGADLIVVVGQAGHVTAADLLL
jgi:Ca2+-binding RTX toxin-like protein